MVDQLDGVAAFVQVVEAGSFTLAAERLHLTRSAVGKAVARLETRLGVRLLHRTTRSQTLTEAGQAFYVRCSRAIAELDAAQAELDSGHTEPRGRLRVSVPLAFGHLCAAPVLFDLARKHPRLQIDISFTDRTIDLIEEGIDLAVRIGTLHDSASLAARRLGVQHMCIGAAPSYLARHGKPGDIDQFEGHVGIFHSRGGVLSPWRVREPDGSERELPVRPQLSLDDVQAIAGAGVAGLGLVKLPSWLLERYIATGELELVRGHCGSQPLPIHAVWPATPYLPLKTRHAIDALVAEIAGMQLA